jgi:hypothetical protein
MADGSTPIAPPHNLAADLRDKLAETRARREALAALPDEAQQILADLRKAWFPLGKTEDYALVRSLFLKEWPR